MVDAFLGLERDPARFLPPIDEKAFEGEVVAIDLGRPMKNILAERCWSISSRGHAPWTLARVVSSVPIWVAMLRAVRDPKISIGPGGGVASSYDPIDVAQYTVPEFRVAVDAAENWGTYVAVHAYTPRAISAAIRGGVRCVEHGHLTTANEMAKHGEAEDIGLPNKEALRKTSSRVARIVPVLSGQRRVRRMDRRLGRRQSRTSRKV